MLCVLYYITTTVDITCGTDPIIICCGLDRTMHHLAGDGLHKYPVTIFYHIKNSESKIDKSFVDLSSTHMKQLQLFDVNDLSILGLIFLK